MTMFAVVLILAQVSAFYGAPGCIDLKKEFPQFKIPRKPTTETDGVCPLTKTCCKLEVEMGVQDKVMDGLRGVVGKEVNTARNTLNTVKTMTAGTMTKMMDELVPEDIKSSIDIPKIGEAIWSYVMNDITAYNLTIEVAVIGSRLLFTDKAGQDLIDMTECIIRELGLHATDAFVAIASIVENELEAPKTFGDGFAVAEKILNSIKNFEAPDDCTYGQLLGCPRCGIRMPAVCSDSCTASANNCLSNVYQQSNLWRQWVESLVQLVDAMVLMKDIKVDPNDIVTPDLIEDVTHDILSSMGDVNFRQCRGVSKRSVATYDPEIFRSKRQMSEGALLGNLLTGFFDSYTLNTNACRGSSSKANCWTGGELSQSIHSNRATKSYTHDLEIEAADALNQYVQKVDDVVSKIHAKVRQQRSMVFYPEGYNSYSRSISLTYNLTLHLLALLLTAMIYRV